MAKKIFLWFIFVGLIVLAVFIILRVSGGGKSEEITYRDDLATMSWDEIVELAKQEREVSWFVWYLQPKFREIAVNFETLYGIEVTIAEGKSGEFIINKAIAEKNLAQGNIDVISSNDAIVQLIKGNLLYESLVQVIPNINTRKTAVGGVDTKGYALSFWGNQTGLAYDPNRIKESELPQTLQDFEDFMKKNPKSFSFSDPSGGNSGTAFIRSVITNLVPQEYKNELENDKVTKWNSAWQWFNDHAGNYVLTATSVDALTRLSDGEFFIVAAWEDQTSKLQKQGAISKNIKFYIPEIGMAGGGNFAAITKNAPNPAAAILFLEWLTSKETQSTFNELMGASPQNTESDDSKALIPQSMRKFSTTVFPQAYEKELKKEFLSKVVF